MIRDTNLREVLSRTQRGVFRLLGPAVIALGHALVGLITYLYFSIPVLPRDTSPLVYYPWTLLGIWLLVNIIFNWDMCCITDPGSPPPAGVLLEGGEGRANGDLPICKKCQVPKPMRAHHCSVSACSWVYANGYDCFRRFVTGACWRWTTTVLG